MLQPLAVDGGPDLYRSDSARTLGGVAAGERDSGAALTAQLREEKEVDFSFSWQRQTERDREGAVALA